MTPDLALAQRLIRRRVRDGLSPEVDRWMEMLRARREECVETLDRERMAVELIFRDRSDAGDYLTWIVIRGPDGASLATSPFSLDHDHRDFARRCLDESTTVEIDAELMLAPPEVTSAIEAFMRRIRDAAESPDSA